MRSKQLWQYLSDTGALNGTEEDIVKAKYEYRKLYKRTWKRDRQKPVVELRPGFSLKEIQAIKQKADELKLTPTALVKNLALSCIEKKLIVPHKHELLLVLQLLGMASTALLKERYIQSSIPNMVLEAERLLLSYMKENDT